MENLLEEDILKKINVLFIVHFCLGEYSFSIDTFWTYIVDKN